MRYLMLYTPAAHIRHDTPCVESQEKMGALIAEMVSAGVMLATDGLQTTSASDMNIRFDQGKYSVTDGPFAESKEMIGGFAILRVKSKEEAVMWAKRFFELAGEGSMDVCLMHDYSPIEMLTGQAVAA